MRQAHSGFREALLALSEEPTYPNVVRYLAASRALEPLGIDLTGVIEVLGPVGD